MNCNSPDWFVLTGAHEEIDYSAKLKFSDDEGDEEGEEENTESNNDSRYVTQTISHIIISDSSTTYFVILVCILFKPVYFSFVPSEQQRSKDSPPATSSSRASDSGAESRHAPSSTADNGPKPPSSKPGRAEEGGSSWGGQGAPSNYQVEMLNQQQQGFGQTSHAQVSEGRQSKSACGQMCCSFC